MVCPPFLPRELLRFLADSGCATGLFSKLGFGGPKPPQQQMYPQQGGYYPQQQQQRPGGGGMGMGGAMLACVPPSPFSSLHSSCLRPRHHTLDADLASLLLGCRPPAVALVSSAARC